MDKERYKKVRLLIRRLNKARRQQTKQIDILCNDMVSAHSDFVEQLKKLTFTVNFYHSLLGQSKPAALLDTAIEVIQSCAANSNVAIFLTESEGFQLHTTGQNKPTELNVAKLESYFTQELVDKICRANWVCSLDDMFEMGLEGNLAELGKISAAAIVLERFGPPKILHRSSWNDTYLVSGDDVIAHVWQNLRFSAGA